MNFIENESAEKLRGGYYTPADIAEYLVRWVGEIGPVRVLEPSCGDGAFIRALKTIQIRELREVLGCELLEAEAAKARVHAAALARSVKASVVAEDFLSWALARIAKGTTFDAVVGNPPFIRYQYLEPSQQERAEALFKRFELPFTKHTNAWVPFVIASLALLRPGGRLAMVVPAELLHVLHAQSLRAYLLRTCSKIVVLDPEEIWFEDTLQGVVLLLAQRADDEGDAKGSLAVNRVRGREFLGDAAGDQIARATFVPGDQLGKKWVTALLTESERALLRELRIRRHVRPFSELAHVAVGIVTGANKFFLVTDEVVERYGLGEFAHAMFGRSEHVPGVLYDKRTHEENRRIGHPTNFLWFSSVARSKLSASVRAYIEMGEAESLQTRYKCRIRSPWYCVPSVFTAPVGMLKRSNDFPRLVLNTIGAFTTDTAYRISVTNGMSAEQLVFSFVNSLTALSAELEGRHYGGGVLELVPSEINQLLLPYVPNIKAECGKLDAVFRKKMPSTEILALQDARVLRPLGLRVSDCDAVRDAWLRLRSRRHRIEGSADAGESVG